MADAAYLRPVWMEVNLDHLAFNLRQVRRFVGSGIKVMAVIKGNAYGAGIEGIIDTLLAGGVDMLGAGILDEALLVRSLGVRTPILIFGYTPFACSELLVKNEIIQTVYSYEQAAALSAAAAGLGRIARIHLEIDTGMGRLGFLPYDAALREIKAIAALPHLQIDGIYTHCPYTNEREGPGRDFTKRQFAEFIRFARRLAAAGVPVPLLHACNSLGILHYPEMHMNMVRAGIILYGSYPGFQQVLPQKPVMALKTRVGSVKYVPAGHNIGYGHTFTAPQDMLVAVLPIGYADGYSRVLSNKAYVLIHGRRVPVIGTICMDQCMVDVTALGEKCRMGDEVVLIGRQGEEEITVEELSMLGCGYINYEYLVGISYRVPRIYTVRQGAVRGEPGK